MKVLPTSPINTVAGRQLWTRKPKIVAAATEKLPQDVQAHMKLMIDLVILAWQMDKTRVSTLIFNRDVSHMRFNFLKGVLNEQLHSISHHKEKADKLFSYQRINQYHVEQFAYLLNRMSQIEEGNGNSLLDNSILMFGSNMFNGDSHDGRNLPLILAGHGGGKCHARFHFAHFGLRFAG